MFIFDLMIIIAVIMSIVLFSGVKMMYNNKYSQIIFSIVIMYTPIQSFIAGYKQGQIQGTDLMLLIIILSILLLVIIWGYRRNKDIYSIHNVKQKDVINIIEKYLQRKNIEYVVRDEEVYFPEMNKIIFIHGLTEVNLDCRKIKDTDFYEELVSEVRVGIKEVKQRYFPYEALFYLFLVALLCWLRFIVFK